jgi:glycine cleavage system aminomethyltransferase T
MTTATPDYTAAITTAALFDTSATGKLELTGPDAPMFLGNLCTNDTKNLPLGGGCEAYFCDSRAKVQFAAWIYHVRLGDGRHAMWVETTAGRNEELLKYLDRYLISEQVEVADVTERFAQFHLTGPKAAEVLSKYIITDMYAKGVQGGTPEDAVKWAEGELKKVYS